MQSRFLFDGYLAWRAELTYAERTLLLMIGGELCNQADRALDAAGVPRFEIA